jgi:lipopolysaccharide transport system permease protein
MVGLRARPGALVARLGPGDARSFPGGGALNGHAETQPVTWIRPGRRALHVNPRELWDARELLYFLVWRDAKVRYKQTVLGALWAIVQPLMTMGVFALFFGRLAGMPSDGKPYPLFAFAALVPWTYFSTALSSASNSLVGSQHLIAKVYFPRLLIPVASVVTPLIDFAISFTVLVAMLLWYGVAPSVTLVAVPAFALLAVTSALAASLWFSALNVEYRDVRYVLPFLLQFWLFATPVAYPASLLPERWRVLYALNPMVSVVEGFRWALLGSPCPGPWSIAVSTITAVVVLAAGLVYFRRVEGSFADVI